MDAVRVKYEEKNSLKNLNKQLNLERWLSG